MYLDFKMKFLSETTQLPHNNSQGSLIPETYGHSEIPITPPPTPTSSGIDNNLTKWPLFGIPSSGGNYISLRGVSVRSDRNANTGAEFNGVNVADPVNNNAAGRNSLEPQTNFGLDFGWLFGWLERAIWVTMIIGILWALLFDFSKATSEFCMREDWHWSGKYKHIPFNVLPSLSRSMSSFQVGKFLWTIMMASVFVARLLSNHSLHKLYESWYADTIWNQFFLFFAYSLDTVEIVSLIMIPAFSLDCDPEEHSFFFQVFICVTYTAELFQFFTKILEKGKDFPEIISENVNNYYKQIGVLIILQTVFIVFMMTGYFLHSHLCGDYYYSIFALGEYITVIVNVRFKRDTVLFVK